ncbi:MAG: AAA family ATPase, partial [Clostridia bacterium]|nr:AAA family ATPase [Clostridia bacterium]
MVIKTLNIISFGGLRNRVIHLDDGVNVVSGPNESGKSSAAMFIKFIFYGLNGRKSRGSVTERQRYVNRTTSQAAGSILCETSDGTEWRIERLISLSDGQSARERVRITNMDTGESTIGQNPGEFFFELPEDVFVSTCFIAQSAQIRPDASGLSATDTAIGNLLSSADESVDVPRAVKNLDAKRRELIHKNGSGGEITALREKRGALAAEMKSTSERAAEIMQLDASLADIKKKIEELEEADEHYTALFSALDKITAKRRVEAKVQTETALDTLTRQLDDLDASPIGTGFTETLLECERDIRAYDEECAVYDERIPHLADGILAEELPDPDEVIAEVKQADSRSRIRFGMAAAFLISGALGLMAALVLYYFNTDVYLLPLAMSLVLVTMGVISVIRHVKSRNELYDLLDRWEAESAAEIETAVTEKLAVLDRRRMMVMEKERMDASLEASKLRFSIASERLTTLAGDADVDSTGDLYDIIDALHRTADAVSEKRAEMVSAAEKLHGRLELLG